MLFNGLPSPERAFCRKTRFSFHYIRHELELDWKGENAYIESLDICAYYFHSESFSFFFIICKLFSFRILVHFIYIFLNKTRLPTLLSKSCFLFSLCVVFHQYHCCPTCYICLAHKIIWKSEEQSKKHLTIHVQLYTRKLYWL